MNSSGNKLLFPDEEGKIVDSSGNKLLFPDDSRSNWLEFDDGIAGGEPVADDFDVVEIVHVGAVVWY